MLREEGNEGGREMVSSTIDLVDFLLLPLPREEQMLEQRSAPSRRVEDVKT